LSESIDAQVNMVKSALPVSSRKMQELKEHTAQDEQLSMLMQVIESGWPVYKAQCQADVRDFWNCREDLSVVDGLIMKGHKLVIPKSLRSNMLEIVHTGHMGVEKTLKRARDIIFWPGISAEIKQLVLNCSTCLEYRNSNTKEPLSSHEIPEYPWQIVGSDLFTWENKHYIVVADYYSHFFEVKELPNMRSSTVIDRMKGIFARMGIPEKCITDNGPCYASEEFAQFSKAWDFHHDTSSPLHSSGNGFSEAYVKICKRILTKAKADHKDPLLGILEYRVTPLEIGYSPSELLMGRQLRSVLPVAKERLMPRYIESSDVTGKLKANKNKEKGYYDQRAKSLPPLELGDSARIQQHNNTWKQAIVVDKHGDRSYTVRTADGATYRRNRIHLNKTNEHMPPLPNVEIQIPWDDATSEKESSRSVENFPEPLNVETPPPISASTRSGTEPYITRSGRTVKPKIIPSM